MVIIEIFTKKASSSCLAKQAYHQLTSRYQATINKRFLNVAGQNIFPNNVTRPITYPKFWEDTEEQKTYRRYGLNKMNNYYMIYALQIPN